MKADAVLGEAKIITALFLLILRKDHVPHEQDILFANLRFFVPGILDTKPDLFRWVIRSGLEEPHSTVIGSYGRPVKAWRHPGGFGIALIEVRG